MKIKVIPLIQSILSILAAIGLMSVFSGCRAKEDGSFMHCHSVQLTLAALFAFSALAALLQLFLRSRAAGILLNLLTGTFGFLAILLPGRVLPMCMMDTMRCYTVMKPFAFCCGIGLILLCLFGLISCLKKREGRRR